MKKSKLFDSLAAMALISVVAFSVKAQFGGSTAPPVVKHCNGQFFFDPQGGVHWFSSWECSVFEDCVINAVVDVWGTVVGYESGCQPTTA